MAPRLWTVVLAAGSGRRLAGVTGGVPKQFWRPPGGRSLLGATLARLAPVAPPERTVVVVDRSHRRLVRADAAARSAGWVVYQPEDRGTAVGVLLGLIPVLESEPDALVVLTPSDHGVADERCYRRGLDAAVSDVARTNRAVLLAVRPSAPNEDYGWIEPAVAAPWPMVQPVASFVEKPPVDHARRLYANGALWNTMVVVARARFVFDLYRAHLPQVASVFEAVLAVPPRVRDGFLQAEYARLPVADFSRDVLMPARGLSVYAWPSSMGWSDLGTPERLRRWLGVEPKVRARATLPAAAATA